MLPSRSRGKNFCERYAASPEGASKSKGMNDEFQLTPIPADAELGELLEAMDPGVERTPESQYCVFRSGRERFCLPVLDVEEVLEWPLVTKLPLSPAYVLGIFNLRGAIVPLIDIALTEGRRTGLLPKHVVVASLRGDGNHDDVRLGIAADEVVGTYSVREAEDLLRQAPENVPHCVGMLRHDDRLALVIDLRRLLEVYPGPSI
jgi:purine-binding chemotaxis protein CheW